MSDQQPGVYTLPPVRATSLAAVAESLYVDQATRPDIKAISKAFGMPFARLYNGLIFTSKKHCELLRRDGENGTYYLVRPMEEITVVVKPKSPSETVTTLFEADDRQAVTVESNKPYQLTDLVELIKQKRLLPSEPDGADKDKDTNDEPVPPAEPEEPSRPADSPSLQTEIAVAEQRLIELYQQQIEDLNSLLHANAEEVQRLKDEYIQRMIPLEANCKNLNKTREQVELRLIAVSRLRSNVE